MPPAQDYHAFVDKIYQSGVLTNQGPCAQEFEEITIRPAYHSLYIMP